MNIYIVGVATSGKSTLAKLIKQKQSDVNVISFEAVRNGFIKAQPDLGMSDRNSVARKEILPSFMVEMAEWNARMTSSLSLVEGTFAKVGQLTTLVSANDMVICLGYGGKNLNEVAETAIANASASSYLFGKTEEEFKTHFYDLEKDDRENIEDCRKYGIKYVDTSENREQVLEEVAEWVVNKILEDR